MFNYDLMKSMGIIKKNSNGKEFIKNVIEKLKSMELDKKNPSKTYIENVERLIMENKIVLGSPILKNILIENEPVSSCTIVPIDLRKDLKNIRTILEPYAATTMGSGYDLNQTDDPCGAIEQISAAIHELIKIYPNRLSAMGTLDVESPHILDFINLKRNRDFDTCHYNISVRIPDNFFEGTREYEIMKCGKKIKVTNWEIINEISDSIYCCGEPGIIFRDRFNETNPFTQEEYQYKSVAPCAEIAMAEGEVCQFSYINLSKFVNDDGQVDKDELLLSIQIITRMLDNLCDISIKNAKTDSKIIEDKRRIGIGVCGYADMLAKMQIEYGSSQCVNLTQNLFTYINFYSKVESVKLARDREPFRKFGESKCSESEWYNRFRKNGKEWITNIDWSTLITAINKFGIRNSSTTAVPPTGRSASIVNASYSIEPYFSLYDYSNDIGLNSLFLEYIESMQCPEDEKRHIIDNVLQSGNCVRT